MKAQRHKPKQTALLEVLTASLKVLTALFNLIASVFRAIPGICWLVSIVLLPSPQVVDPGWNGKGVVASAASTQPLVPQLIARGVPHA